MRRYAMSDIHGKLDLLMEALGFIEVDCVEHAGQPIPCQIIFLGDYIDRGPDSRKVLQRLRSGPSYSWQEWIVIRGNHDDMMLQGTRYQSEEHRECWMANGGLTTLWNYDQTPRDEALADNEMVLDRAAMDVDLDFIESMKLWHEDETNIYVHAGITNVGFGHYTMAMQDPQTLMWCRPREMDLLWPGRCDKVVVHGHTPHYAGIPGKTIGIDGGAFTPRGCLKVAVFEDKEDWPSRTIEFRSVGAILPVNDNKVQA